MYESFFGLQREPFSIAPDPRFLYMSDKHREALALLNYGLTRGASFVLLTGEIGAGKTTVWRRFLEELPSNFDVASVVNPTLDVNALAARVCEDLHVELPAAGAAVDLIDALHGHLLLAHAQGRRTLIAIDEAQALSNEVLEQLRLLTNLDSSGKKLQVMLIGQPELRQMLERPQLEPLAQRVVARYHLPALSDSETAGYIAHRLAVAGLRGPLPFDGESLALIHRLCRGVPRRINVICDRAMATAQASGSRRIDRNIVERAVIEVYGKRSGPTPAAPAPSRAPGYGWVVAGAAGVALAAGVLLAPRFAATPTAAPAVAAAPAAAAALATAPSPQPAVATTPVTAPAPPRTVLAVAAPAPAPAAPPPMLGVDAAFTPAAADEAQAWRALAGWWGAALGPGEPCAAALSQSLHCFRSRGGLAALRQLDRPGILRLVDERGRVAYALLTALGDERATLNFGGAELELPLPQLARLWRGEFATYWRAPPGYREGDIASNSGVLGGWLAQHLAGVDSLGSLPPGGDALRSRIAAFQLAQGLTPDGLAGPLTLMQISRASGIDEPRLSRRLAGAYRPP